MCCAGLQHAFCKAHMSSLGPAATAAACGLDWPSNLFPTVIPGVASQVPTVQMIAYKPGASQLPTYWSTPHRSALHSHCTGCAAQSRCSLSYKFSRSMPLTYLAHHELESVIIIIVIEFRRTMLYCSTSDCSILKLGSLHASSLGYYIHARTSTCSLTNLSTETPFLHSHPLTSGCTQVCMHAHLLSRQL